MKLVPSPPPLVILAGRGCRRPIRDAARFVEMVHGVLEVAGPLVHKLFPSRAWPGFRDPARLALTTFSGLDLVFNLTSLAR